MDAAEERRGQEDHRDESEGSRVARIHAVEHRVHIVGHEQRNNGSHGDTDHANEKALPEDHSENAQWLEPSASRIPISFVC